VPREELTEEEKKAKRAREAAERKKAIEEIDKFLEE
jgi:hypothetical protein